MATATTSTGLAAGLSPSGIQTTSSATAAPLGAQFNYTVAIQLPVPFLNLNLNLNLLADFVLPVLSVVGIPQAILFLLNNATTLFQNIIDDAQDLIRAIPEATVTILVKLGPAIIFNVQLVAKKIPTVISPPTFQLALPNFAVDTNFGIELPFPAPPPVVIEIPIPYPIVKPVPLLGIGGGQVSASASAAVSVAPGSPPSISSPISLPSI
jgi:hypothetical protein